MKNGRRAKVIMLLVVCGREVVVEQGTGAGIQRQHSVGVMGSVLRGRSTLGARVPSPRIDNSIGAVDGQGGRHRTTKTSSAWAGTLIDRGKTPSGITVELVICID